MCLRHETNFTDEECSFGQSKTLIKYRYEPDLFTRLYLFLLTISIYSINSFLSYLFLGHEDLASVSIDIFYIYVYIYVCLSLYLYPPTFVPNHIYVYIQKIETEDSSDIRHMGSSSLV